MQLDGCLHRDAIVTAGYHGFVETPCVHLHAIRESWRSSHQVPRNTVKSVRNLRCQNQQHQKLGPCHGSVCHWTHLPSSRFNPRPFHIGAVVDEAHCGRCLPSTAVYAFHHLRYSADLGTVGYVSDRLFERFH